MYIYIYIYIYTYIYIYSRTLSLELHIYIYTSVQSPTLSSLEKRLQSLDICADTEIGICFSLHLCVVFLFLVRYSLVTSFLLPPAASF